MTFIQSPLKAEERKQKVKSNFANVTHLCQCVVTIEIYLVFGGDLN